MARELNGGGTADTRASPGDVRIPRLVFATGIATGVVAAIIIGLINWRFVYRRIPLWYELPLFLSPLVMLIVASASLVAYGHLALDRKTNPGKIIMSCVLAGLVSLAACVAFAHPGADWRWHLALLFFLYLIFTAWDMVMLCWLAKKDSTIHRRVLRGCQSVNLPTLITVLLVGAFLVWLFEAPTTSVGAKEWFVRGLVSFHLCLGAFGYIIPEFPWKKSWGLVSQT